MGSSNGAIEVEAVGLDKIRSRLGDLSRLRDVSLDGEAVAWLDPPGKISTACPSSVDSTTREQSLILSRCQEPGSLQEPPL